ncbi:hypothetical protein BaRGS_00027909, partial [Batillaria attramentaria]
ATKEDRKPPESQQDRWTLYWLQSPLNKLLSSAAHSPNGNSQTKGQLLPDTDSLR